MMQKVLASRIEGYASYELNDDEVEDVQCEIFKVGN